MNREILQPLTREQVDLLKQSFGIIDTDRLAMRFYTALFVKHPEVKKLFPDDLTVLSTKIISVFELVIYSFREAEKNQFMLEAELLTPLRTLGELHSRKGVMNMHYPWVNELLLQSIAEEAQSSFTPAVEVAWKLALNHLTVAMLDNQRAPREDHETMQDSYRHIRSLLFKTD